MTFRILHNDFHNSFAVTSAYPSGLPTCSPKLALSALLERYNSHLEGKKTHCGRHGDLCLETRWSRWTHVVRVEQRLGFFQKSSPATRVSPVAGLVAGTFILHGANACVSGAVDRYRASPALSKLRAEGSMGRNGHRKSKLYAKKQTQRLGAYSYESE
ncbi:hypothetical protein EVAR_643_1 [Eumeta japonica]|uniref:Uncharacterized protein n=1 Tax=Eumeta variegata TaxID=151549 RepID=A0A4C1SBL7_EUMVA|nr:hypothetical protein EVAR_643_1 [Eumeta japonica]